MCRTFPLLASLLKGLQKPILGKMRRSDGLLDQTVNRTIHALLSPRKEEDRPDLRRLFKNCNSVRVSLNIVAESENISSHFWGLIARKVQEFFPNLNSFPVANLSQLSYVALETLHPESLIPQNMVKILHRYTASRDPPTICFSGDLTNHSIG
ncbi:hypothetical protein TNIN_452141 [Trichonephila inaurata madagascariensis]|uniref:Uncharacterized protein n=1 Tax=Trichonephila inaurata madagascariensis TaxID=2747483 RepID=A0A8X6Y632_9ARAC|nr:hypothetical protein TNIN_452141 [Trichonephila inaurata madagascariensis]